MSKKVTDNNKIFTLFRQSEEPNFIKFLDTLGDNYVKETTSSDRLTRQNNRQFNRRQEQTLQRNYEVTRDNKKYKISESFVKV